MLDHSGDLTLPPNLPVPEDDGACDHLVGLGVPDVPLPATTGEPISIARAQAERTVVYAYPRAGQPLVDDWDLIPGARGCTPEACSFRDHHAELAELGAGVYGLSTQASADQRELAERLDLPFPLLSDEGRELTNALRLPTFEVASHVLLRRHTLVVSDGRIEHVFYPVFPPDRHAAEVVGWLRERTAEARGSTG